MNDALIMGVLFLRYFFEESAIRMYFERIRRVCVEEDAIYTVRSIRYMRGRDGISFHLLRLRLRDHGLRESSHP
jgi:hypothetical protein